MYDLLLEVIKYLLSKLNSRFFFQAFLLNTIKVYADDSIFVIISCIVTRYIRAKHNTIFSVSVTHIFNMAGVYGFQF